MNLKLSIVLALLLIVFEGFSQQQTTIISKCGGWDTITIPNVIDLDQDGMDDGLEQMLLDRFMPYIVQYNSDDCPGPNTDGSGDTNLIVSRIYPIPQQYTATNSIDSLKLSPTAIVPTRGLTVGLYWYPTIIKVNAALLYGKDCGLIGHTADVEGFNFSLMYTGNLPGGWMYDTGMQNWMGGTIQTISHAGTFCEAVQTFPYRSTANPTGKDTIYPSPDKHGSFLTVAQCSSNFICDPACSGGYTRNTVKNINVGEPGAPLVSNLGSIYAPYNGEDPWGNADFLGGGAGTIKSKMALDPDAAFFQGVQLHSQATICNLYRSCYGNAGSAFIAFTCAGTPYGFFNQQLTTPGVYTETLQTPYGCDSVITLTLNIVQPDSVTIQAGACSNSSYWFNGQQLTTSGVYQATFTNSQGCDSVVTLNLTISNTIITQLSTTLCPGESTVFAGQTIAVSGTYTDTLTATGGCDSIVTLQVATDTVAVTLLAQAICAGDTFNFNGNSLTLPGLYIDTLASQTGCDSMVTLQLLVLVPPAQPVINVSGNGLSVDTTGISGYQWYFNGMAIPGANSSSYTASNEGYYQLEVSNGINCSTFSDSLYFVPVGIKTSPILPNVILYPNPANHTVTITLPPAETATLQLISVSGKVLHQEYLKSNSITLSLASYTPGLYFVKLSGPNLQWVGKLVKE